MRNTKKTAKRISYVGKKKPQTKISRFFQKIASSKPISALLVMVVFGSLGGAYLIFSKAATIPVVRISQTPTHDGYWLATSDGAIKAYGTAQHKGDLKTSKITPFAPVTDVASNGKSDGYWLLGTDGGVFTFGSAKFYGSDYAPSNGNPYTALVSTPSGLGYWVISQYGHVVPHGDALTTYKLDTTKKNYTDGGFGSVKGATKIVDADKNSPGTGMYLLDITGKVYVIGTAADRGPATLKAGEHAASISADGAGVSYVVTTDKGTVTGFSGYAATVGDLTGKNVNGVVGIQVFGTPAAKNMSYWLAASSGTVYHFGQAKDFNPVTPQPTCPTGQIGTPPNCTKPPAGGKTYNGTASTCKQYIMVLTDKGTCVGIVQGVLSSKSYVVTVNSIMDGQTVASLKSYQQDNHITVNGVVDVPTWAKLIPEAPDGGHCAPGQVGQPPNCHTPCPSNQPGPQKSCPTCPRGQTGTPPNCHTPPPPPAGIACDGNGTDGLRVQVVYAYFEGEKDDYSAKLTSIKGAVARINTELLKSAQRAGGVRQFRFVHDNSANCHVSIAKVMIKRADQSDDIFRNFGNMYEKYGLKDQSRKYLVFLDHYSTVTSTGNIHIVCGVGSFFEPTLNGSNRLDPAFIDRLKSQGAVINSQADYDALFSSPNANINISDNTTGIGLFPIGYKPPTGYTFGDGTKVVSCWGPFIANGDNKPMDVQLHELMHAFGVVRPDSPHHGLNGHCSDKYDAICYEDSDASRGQSPFKLDFTACPNPLDNYLLDCHNDDYFAINPPAGSYLSTHWNAANSRFLINR